MTENNPRTEETAPADPNLGGAHPVEAGSAQSRPGENGSAEARPVESCQAETYLTGTGPVEPGQAEARPVKNGYLFSEILESIVIAVILAVLIRVFLFQPFYIPSGSMEPTLTKGDRIIVNKITYRFTEPKWGDIIVFKYPLNPKRDFIKRVIGLPGDTIQLKNSTLYVNGKAVNQSFLPQGLKYGNYGPVTMADDAYFMMGDNRNNSEDSRVWGTLPRENIVGKATVIYWPLNRSRILH